MKKYSIWYANITTGYGWTDHHDRLDEFEDFINEMRNEYTAKITVWDEEIQTFIFWKDGFTYKPRIDMLHTCERDMRTTTRRRINVCQKQES